MVVHDFKPYAVSVNVRENISIKDMVEWFVNNPRAHNICVVDENGKLKGLINRKNIFRTVFSNFVSTKSRVTKLYKLITAEKAEEIMSSHVIRVTEDEDIDKVIKKMIQNDLFEIPVTDNEMHILGFLTSSEILKKLAKQQGF